MRELGSTWTRACMPRLRWAAAIAGVAVLLSGCGGSSNAAPAPSPSAAPVTFSAEEAAVALDEVIWTIRAQGTGTFDESGAYTYPKGKGTRHGYERAAGSYDLRDESWQAQRTFSPDDSGEDFEQARRAIGPVAYVQDGKQWYAWPGLGRRGGTGLTTTFGTMTTPMPLYLLSWFAASGMHGTAIEGGRVITGSIPANWALYAAGVAEVYDTDARSAYDLTGNVPAELIVAADGRPQVLTLDFATAQIDGDQLTSAWREALSKAEYQASFDNAGMPVEVNTPTGAVIVDPPDRARSEAPELERTRV